MSLLHLPVVNWALYIHFEGPWLNACVLMVLASGIPNQEIHTAGRAIFGSQREFMGRKKREGLKLIPFKISVDPRARLSVVKHLDFSFGHRELSFGPNQLESRPAHFGRD